MGVACGDFDGDGRPDLAVTNFYGESTTFFRNLGRGMFSDDTATIGLAGPTRCLLGFGIAFLDANNDGWLDLISANGHINDHRPALPWRMPTQLLLGGPDGRLKDPVARRRRAVQTGSTLAADWPWATWTTTAGSTPSFSLRTSRWPIFITEPTRAATGRSCSLKEFGRIETPSARESRS